MFPYVSMLICDIAVLSKSLIGPCVLTGKFVQTGDCKVFKRAAGSPALLPQARWLSEATGSFFHLDFARGTSA